MYYSIDVYADVFIKWQIGMDVIPVDNEYTCNSAACQAVYILAKNREMSVSLVIAFSLFFNEIATNKSFSSLYIYMRICKAYPASIIRDPRPFFLQG